MNVDIRNRRANINLQPTEYIGCGAAILVVSTYRLAQWRRKLTHFEYAVKDEFLCSTGKSVSITLYIGSHDRKKASDQYHAKSVTLQQQALVFERSGNYLLTHDVHQF